MAQKRAPKLADVADDEAIIPLQAVLLADSFAQKFRPITLERPKVLLPLVNVPMIEYTLHWLASAGVEEVFVFCCSHAKQVASYLERSNWLSQPSFNVVIIESHDCVSAGDAIRVIEQRNVVRGDFVLVSGDTVSNMSLKDVVEQHQERRRHDKLAVMTMVVKRSKSNPSTHQTRLGNNELVLAINPNTKQLLYYDAWKDSTGVDPSKPDVALDWSLFSETSAIQLHSDLQDCHIDICSPEVLYLFTDNFDYQQLRRDFVRGILGDEVMGNKIFTYEISGDYAARIDNLRGYDIVSQDIIHRWTYPMVPDSQIFKQKNDARVTVDRCYVYKADGVVLARTAVIEENTVMGEGTAVGENTVIRKSVIGSGCIIGKNVLIEGCHIWNNVNIHDNAKLRHAIVCDGSVVKTQATLEPGVVLSFNVVIGPNFVVPEYSKISLVPQPTEEDSSDEELEYVDTALGNSETSQYEAEQALSGSVTKESETIREHDWDAEEVGVTGAGYRWSIKEGGQEEEWRHSVAPIPLAKIQELQLREEQLEIEAAVHDDGTLVGRQAQADAEVDDEEQGLEDDFDKEVEETFRRAVSMEGVKQEHVVIEVNSLKLAYNRSFSDCAGALFRSLLNLALEAPHSTSRELYDSTKHVFAQWGPLLQNYVKAEEEEVEVLLLFEEVCLESSKDFASLFAKVLQLLYDKDLISENSIMTWAEEKKDADESDRVFLKQCEPFIKWLQEAEEEDEGE